jgi:dipeptidyl aminopeptidase/acylaminoacyl peptidase
MTTTEHVYRVLHEARPGSRALTPEILWSIPRVGTPLPAPDGSWLVVPVTTYDVEENRGTTRLWRVDTQTGASRPLTSDARSASAPALSPDGLQLAFVAKDPTDKKAKAQVYVLPTDGGEAACYTDLPLGAFEAKWLPDGSGLIVGAHLFLEQPTVEGSRAEQMRRDEEPYEVYASEDRMFRFWDRWLIGGTLAHLFHLDLDTRVVRDLMPGSTLWWAWMDPAGHFDLAPDGTEIVFDAPQVGGPDKRLRTDVYRLPITAEGAQPEWLSREAPASATRPRYTPDGAGILYGRSEDADFYADRMRLWLFDRTTGESRPLLEGWDRAPEGWTFGPDGAIWLQAEDDGAQKIYRLDLEAAQTDGTAPAAYVEEGTCGAPQPAGDGWVYFARHRSSDPTEVWRVPAGGGTVEQVTRFTHAALRDVALGEVRDYRFEGAEGVEVQAVVILPPDHEPGERRPLVHSIHGGPHGLFGDLWHYRWNTHLFAEPGYVVACVNFQGSTSWGNDFAQCIQGAWGDRPYHDVMKATDHLLAEGLVDESRMAISGGSYGGYLTSWIATQTDRFRCAVNHAGVFDLALQYASDVTWGRPRNMGAQIWDDPQQVDRWNPARHTAGLNTPMLVIHGEKDYRVPINHALECYGILQARGIESRLLYFSDENHWILKPKNSLRWYAEVHTWFRRFLDMPDA